jgi:hypothetical protein
MRDPPNAHPGLEAAEPNDIPPAGDWWEMYQDPSSTRSRSGWRFPTRPWRRGGQLPGGARPGRRGAGPGWFPTSPPDPSVIRSRASASANPAAASVLGHRPGTTTSTPRGPAGTGTRTLYTLPLEASYEVDLWGRVRNQSRRAGHGAGQRRNLQTALLSTQSQLARTISQLRATDEQRRILDTHAGRLRGEPAPGRRLFNNGLASDEDLAEADTQLDSAEAQATDLGVARAQYEHAIAVLIGVPPANFRSPSAFNAALPAVPLGCPRTCSSAGPDVAAAERQVAAANAGIGIARAAYFPNLTLNASAGFEATSLNQAFRLAQPLLVGRPEPCQPLFDGGLQARRERAGPGAVRCRRSPLPPDRAGRAPGGGGQPREPADPLEGGDAAAPGDGRRPAGGGGSRSSGTRTGWTAT